MEEKLAKDAFGEYLKREREMRGVTLQEISSATRIAVRFLEAIETEQWDQLPGGVFNRGFVRAVAHYLGLDEESVVAEYALAVGDRPTVPVWTGSPPAVTPQMPWSAWGMLGVLAILLLAGGWFGTRRIISWRAARRAARENATSVSPPGAAVAAPASGGPPENSQDQAPATDSQAPRLELKIEASLPTTVTVTADTLPVFSGAMKAGEMQNFTAQDKFQITATDAGALQWQLDGQSPVVLGRSREAGTMTLTRDTLQGAAGGAH